MTQPKGSSVAARTLFWERMTELVLEYNLYTFDPNIKQMEREIMEAYDEAAQSLLSAKLSELLEKLSEKQERNIGTINLTTELDRGYNLALDEVRSLVEKLLREVEK